MEKSFARVRQAIRSAISALMAEALTWFER